MKGLGLFALVVGIVVAIVAFTMDVSVPTGYGSRVNNIGLMSERQNYILIGCFIILCGLLGVIFGKKHQETRRCPYCAEPINVEAIKCKHCGSSVKSEKDKPSSINYSFSLLNCDENELTGTKSGNKIINDYGVKKLIFELKKNNPKINSHMLKLKYNNELYELSNRLPSNLRDEFIKKAIGFIDN
ncbi:hypothetical protein [Providencia phage PSTCR8lys]|nr:hypothetical protein [Providencia phage PSTCR8lys]